MENKINKMISLILLLSMLNGNVLSMQKSDIEPNAQEMEIDQDVQQEYDLLNLPAEVIEYILYQIIKPYKDSINEVNNVFDYCQINLKPLVSDLSGISLTSKDFRLWTLDLIDRLKKLKDNKYQMLINQIKDQYQGVSEDELNTNLRDILNQLPIDRNGLEKAAKLILADANVNEKNNYGNTALMFAAINAHKDIVQLLIDKGANVNEKGVAGYAALAWAVFNDDKDIAQLLIDNKADVNEKNNDGDTALIEAAIRDHISIVQLLINNGVNVNEKSKNGNTALIEAAINGHIDIVQLLIKAKANINEKNNYGNTALMLAVINGHIDIVQLLIDNCANINEKNNYGDTALMLAAINGHINIVQLLIDNCANINEKDNDGDTALILAKKHNHIDIISLLQAPNVKEKHNYNCIVF